MFPKKMRIEDPELLSLVRTLPCMACGIVPSEAHHVTTRGAGGDDVPQNIMPLCVVHHSEWHTIGPVQMMEKYPIVDNWLEVAEREDIRALRQD